MKHLTKGIILCVLLLFTMSGALAQEGKKKWLTRVGEYVQGTPWQFDSVLPTTHTKYLLRIGQVGIMDEYLSPISHKGLDFGLSILTDGSIRRPEDKWHYYGEVSLHLGMPKNPANTTVMHVLGGYYLGGAAYRVLQDNRWAVDIAPAIALNIQSQVKLSNTNNIINLKGDLGFDAWGRVMYRIPWQVMPISFSYSMQIPLLHLAYHPHFGQSYFDYVSGENGAKVRFYPTSLHNTLGIRQRLLIDFPVRSTTITVGLEHSYLQQKLNSTKYKMGYWSCILGISLDRITFSGNRSTRSRQIISPIYPTTKP